MLYTKTGDKGMTSLANCQRVSKCDPRLEAYGTIDELNSHIGLLISLIADFQQPILSSIQSDLFVIGSILAGAEKMSVNDCKLRAEDIEKEIDNLTEQVPQLKSFVLPAGTQPSCQAHICRTVCRRAERLIWALISASHSESESDNKDSRQHILDLTPYINRLSDYFFVLARFLNVKTGATEVLWKASH